MALKFYWDCSSTTLSASSYSGGDSVADVTNATAGVAGAAKIGSTGLRLDGGVAANARFDAASIWPSYDDPSLSAGSFGCWIKFGSLPGNGIACGVRGYGTTTTDRIAIQGVTGSKLAICCCNVTNGSVLVDTASWTASTGVWYFLIGRWSIPGNKMKIEVYTDNAGSLVEQVVNEDTGLALSTTYLPTTDFTIFQVQKASSQANDVDIDNLILSDNYDALLQNNAYITDYANYTETAGHPARSRARGIPGMNDIRSRLGRGW